MRHVTRCLNGFAAYLLLLLLFLFFITHKAWQQSYLLLETFAKLHNINHFALTNSGILRDVIRTSLTKALFTATEVPWILECRPRLYTGCANKKQSPRKKFYISGIVADSFSRFMLLTEEDLGHVSSKLHWNIWFNSKIITIWT